MFEESEESDPDAEWRSEWSLELRSSEVGPGLETGLDEEPTEEAVSEALEASGWFDSRTGLRMYDSLGSCYSRTVQYSLEIPSEGLSISAGV
jgi:hypothetical protein